MDPIIYSFNGGETDPECEGRMDIDKYQSSCRKMENFVPKLIGSAFRRPGLYLAGAAADDTKLSRTIGFVFSTQQAYDLEFSNLALRVFKDKGQVVVDGEDAETFDPAEAIVKGVYRGMGDYIARDCGGGKTLYIAAPFDLVTTGITIAVVSAGIDTLSVTAVGGAVTINLANTTGSNNAANLIQVLFRALGTIAGVDLSDWTVTENAAYTAARPAGGVNVVAAALTSHNKVYQAADFQFASANNGNGFPPVSASLWTEKAEGTVVSIVTPFLSSELMDLKVAQDDNTMYIVHPSHPIYQLTRTSHTSWELTHFVPSKYASKAITGATKANPCVISSTGHGMETGDLVYINSMLGMTELNRGFYSITKIGADSYSLDGVNSSGYNAYTSGGTGQPTWFGVTDQCPSFIGFYEQRLCAGCTTQYPQDIWSSKSATYDNMILGTSDDNAFRYRVKSYSSDKILWMLSMDVVYLGTVSGVWRFGASTAGEPVTPTNINAKKLLSYGCSPVDAVIANDVGVFVTRGGLNLREIVYSLSEDKMVSNDLNIVAAHVTKGETESLSGIVDVDVQQEPLPIIWCVRNDGQLLGLLYERSQKIFGWFRVVTDGMVESVSVLPNAGKEDEVWISTRRMINGTVKRFIEYFKPVEFWNDITQYFGVDCGITFDGGPAVDITGITATNPPVVSAAHSFTNGDKVQITEVLGMTQVNQDIDEAYTVSNVVAGVSFELQGIDGTTWSAYASGGSVRKVAKDLTGIHLPGEEVAILVDGAVHDNETVTAGGAVTLDYYGNLIHVGLPFTAILTPQKIEAATAGGTTKNRNKRIVELMMGVYRSKGATVGRSETMTDDVAFDEGGSDTDLYTGPKVIPLRGDLGYSADVVIMQEDPLPLTVTYVAAYVEIDN